MDRIDPSEDSPYEFDDDDGWLTDLETVLLDECDFGTLRNICRGRPIPSHLRADVWRICLLATASPNAATESSIEEFDELFNLPDQTIVRADCQDLVQEATERPEQLALICDLESVVTHFCRVTGLAYNPDWKSILRPLTTLEIERQDLYAFFASIMTRYIPSCPPEHTYQVLRLLLQYHAPDLCSFLETKKISPESYAGNWLSSIFASAVPRTVLPSIWDVYFQMNDPFLMFFLCLVILINAKDQLLEMSDASKEEIIQTLCSVPAALEAEDVEDFCSLAQHYVSNTPESCRSQFYPLLFPSETEKADDMDLTPINSLCLSITVGELLRARTPDEQVRYLLVDCRPPDQYNAGHLPTAFHLDSELMLRNPSEFQTTAQALLATQRQAVAAGSQAAGEHLCFLSSGREQEDQLMNMVVAHFLQRKTPYVSLVAGGYGALHERLSPHYSRSLAGHDPRACPECCYRDSSSEAGGVHGVDSDTASFSSLASGDAQAVSEMTSGGASGGLGAANAHSDKSMSRLISRFSSAVRVKSSAVKEKMVRYVKNEDAIGGAGSNGGGGSGSGSGGGGGSVSSDDAVLSGRHVSQKDKTSRPYRNTNLNVFSIDDDADDGPGDGDISVIDGVAFGEEVDAEERQELISLEVWLRKPDLLQAFPCRLVRRRDSSLIPGYLLLTERHLFVLRLCPERKNMAYIMHRRPLASIVRITSKKKLPELITFKYGMADVEGVTQVVDSDRAIIPEAGDAAKAIKMQILKVLQALEDVETPTCPTPSGSSQASSGKVAR